MSDLVDRLRELARHEHDDLSIADEAADRIIELEQTLPDMVRTPWDERLEKIVRRSYDVTDNPQEVDGAQMWRGKWWAPAWGCDTLAHVMDDVLAAMERR